MFRSIPTMISYIRLMMRLRCNKKEGLLKQPLLLYYFFTTGSNNLVAAPS